MLQSEMPRRYRLLPSAVCSFRQRWIPTSGRPKRRPHSAAFRVARFLADTVFAYLRHETSCRFRNLHRIPPVHSEPVVAGRQNPPASKTFRHSDIAVAFKATFEVFTRVGSDNPLERLAECSVGLVTDRPGDVYELFVTLFE